MEKIIIEWNYKNRKFIVKCRLKKYLKRNYWKINEDCLVCNDDDDDDDDNDDDDDDNDDDDDDDVLCDYVINYVFHIYLDGFTFVPCLDYIVFYIGVLKRCFVLSYQTFQLKQINK